MRSYLVRLMKNAELVGLFVSPSVNRLWDYIDECCDPRQCEYLLLPDGGLYLGASGAPQVPAIISETEDDGPDPDFFAGATVSELWLGIFYGSEAHFWEPVIIPGDEFIVP